MAFFAGWAEQEMTKHAGIPAPFGERICEGRADCGLDGSIRPLKFRPENGPAVVIDRILDVRQAPALKEGGQGMRYTCRTGERTFCLFYDRSLWFIETD